MIRDDEAFRAAALELLEELESSRLEVILVPQRVRTNEGGMVRCAISKNVRWYRAFCAAHVSSRKRRNAAVDTRIRRAETVKALRALASGNRAGTVYATRLAPIVEARAVRIGTPVREPQPF